MLNGRLITALMLGAALMYLALFVPRGWIPHDEGMIGQSAERVLLGGTPHVDYQEPYTGGLTLLYASVFKIAGIDLLNLRWLLWAGASLALVAMYAILRRYLPAVGVAFVTWVGLAWSFPNYFAGLPSWWVLICALGCLWAFVRFVETEHLMYAALAGVAAGLAILVKQTGLYLLIALVMSLLYESGGGIWRVGRIAVAIAAAGLAIAILSSRLALAEVLYLLLPIVACSRVLLTASGSPSGTFAPAVAVAAAALPIAAFLVPYVIHGHVGSFVQGAFVLPQKRLVFASMSMPSAGFILTGLPLVSLVMPLPRMWPSAPKIHLVVLPWVAALTLSIASLYQTASYQMVWQSARAFTALLPLAIGWLLISGRVPDSKQRRLLFGFASMLDWASLVQFPFSPAIYFCYVTPLAAIAAAAAAANSGSLARHALVAWAALLLAFGVAVMNRGYIYNLGYEHDLYALNDELNLPRAHFRVSKTDALMYQRIVFLISNHLEGGRLVAGPDCPEVYFLAGYVNPSGTLFDFFSNSDTDWAGAQIVVLNHRPAFSAELAPAFLSEMRRLFPKWQPVGHFEVRWR